MQISVTMRATCFVMMDTFSCASLWCDQAFSPNERNNKPVFQLPVSFALHIQQVNMVST